MANLCKKLHSLYKLYKGDIVVGDIKLQRSPLQNSNFVITLSVGFVRFMSIQIRTNSDTRLHVVAYPVKITLCNYSLSFVPPRCNGQVGM